MIGVVFDHKRRRRAPYWPPSAPARPQGEEERSGEDHPGSRPGVENFRKIEKIFDFQSALFGLKIELDRLWVCISHGAGSCALEII